MRQCLDLQVVYHNNKFFVWIYYADSQQLHIHNRHLDQSVTNVFKCPLTFSVHIIFHVCVLMLTKGQHRVSKA